MLLYVIAVLLALVGVLVGVVVGLRFEPKAKTLETRLLSEAHALYDAGLIRKDHVVDWFEAKIASERANAHAQITHAQVALHSVDEAVKADVVQAVDGVVAKL
jgi:hypothetical protein